MRHICLYGLKHRLYEIREPLVVYIADVKTVGQIGDEIRAAFKLLRYSANMSGA